MRGVTPFGSAGALQLTPTAVGESSVGAGSLTPAGGAGSVRAETAGVTPQATTIALHTRSVTEYRGASDETFVLQQALMFSSENEFANAPAFGKSSSCTCNKKRTPGPFGSAGHCHETANDRVPILSIRRAPTPISSTRTRILIKLVHNTSTLFALNENIRAASVRALVQSLRPMPIWLRTPTQYQ